MKLLDTVLLIILAVGGYRGFKKGLVLELFSVIALILAKIGSTKLVRRVIITFFGWYQGANDPLTYVVLAVLFLSILTLITLLGQLISYLIKPTTLGSLDRFLGSLVGIFKWAVCCSACIWLSNLVQFTLPEAYTEHTLLFPLVESLIPRLFTWTVQWLPQATEGIWPITERVLS